MSKYLDETGLSHFWGKIKDYLTRNHLTPVQSKTYTGINVTSNNSTNGYIYFAKLLPDNNDWTKGIYIKYRVHANMAGITDNKGEKETELELYMYSSSIIWYKVKNAIQNTSYYPFYATAIYRATNAGLTDGYGHLLGLRLYSSYSPTSSTYARTITYEILETRNCSVTFFDTPFTYANAPGTGATNYTAMSEHNGTTQGDTHSGDANDVNYYNREYYIATKTKTYLGRYQLCLTTSDGLLLPINTTNNDVTKTKTLTEEPFDPFGDIYYHATTTTYNAGANMGANGSLYRQYLSDLRYSFNTGGSTDANSELTAYLPLYLVCTPQSDGTAKLYSSPLSQSLPELDDGLLYIYLGNVYSDTNPYRICLHPFHQVYMYKNGGIRAISSYSLYAADAGTVNGHTVAKNVPSNAVFTDTTYSNATTSAAGLMSSSDKSKLDGVASGAEVNTVTDVKVNGSSVLSNKVASVTVKDGFGQFQIKNAGGTISQQDIDAGLNPGSPFYIKEGSNVTLTVDTTSAVPGITIAATDTTYSEATQSTAGLMSAADKTALDNLASGTVSDVQVNGTSVVSNSVANIPLASSSANGVMSSSQYTKLDGIEAGAEVNTVTDVQLNGTSILSNGVANIPIVSSSSPGAMSSAMNTKLSKTNVVFATTSSAASAAIKELTFGNTVTIENGTILMLQSTYTNSTTGVTFKKTGTAGSGVAVKYNGAGIGSSTLLYAGSASRISMYVFYDSAWHWIGWSYETNTTYSAATTSSNGLMSSSDKTKLNSIDTGAEVNQAAYSYVRATRSNGTDYIQWPANSKTEVFYVKEGSNIAFSQDDYTGELVISATDTTYSAATTSVDGLMSSADKTKLNGIDTGAEVNQNAFGSFSFGYSSGGAPVLDTIDASSKTDSLTFTAGVNIGFLVDETNKAVTISATDTTYSTMSSSDIVTGTSTTTMVATPKAIHDAIESMINTALANVLTVTTS